MPHRYEPRGDPEGSSATADRYAGFDTENGYVLYDTETPTAWIQSDAAVDPTENA